jgi:hypothetical protein
MGCLLTRTYGGESVPPATIAPRQPHHHKGEEVIRMSRRLTTRPVLSVILALTLLASGAVTADAAITPQATAPPIAQAIVASAPTLVSSSFASLPPAGAPNGTANAPFGSFPTNGSTFGILTTGSVALADDPNNFGDDGLDDQGDNVRGNTDYDVSILRVNLNVPVAANCLTFDFKFASEEFPEYVNQGVNDAFVAEVDTSNWTANNNTVTAPNNFAFAPSGGVVSIDTPGIGASAANAAGTTYDGATSLLSASTPITAGAHSVYLSIFDQGDNVYDSAALLDNLRLTTVANPAVNCKRGATQTGTISARGTFTAAAGGAVQLSAANDCDPASSTRGFQVRWTGGSFTKTTVTNSSCLTDSSLPTSPAGFNKQEGTANGTLQGGAPGTISWTFKDGGPGGVAADRVAFTIRNAQNQVVKQVNQQVAGALSGTPGGVWTFAG